jgi:hypothetical protein
VKHFRNRRFWQAVLAALLIPIALIAFWPTPVGQPVQGLLADSLGVLHRHGVLSWFNYPFVEASANVTLFVPVGFVSALSFPEKRWWQIGALGLLVSGCIELGQLLFLHNRFASPVGIVTNVSGTVIGALVTVIAMKRLEALYLAAADLQ